MKSGDIVKLKSSDSKMTVRWVRKAQQNGEEITVAVICTWFNHNLDVVEHEFRPEQLEALK